MRSRSATPFGKSRPVRSVHFGSVTSKMISLHPLMCCCEFDDDSPEYQCSTCGDWHQLSCLGLSSKDQEKKGSCLPCKKKVLLKKLCSAILEKNLPPYSKLKTVCSKLCLPTSGNQNDLVVRLTAFLPLRALPKGYSARLNLSRVYTHTLFLRFTKLLRGIGQDAQIALLKSLGESRLASLCEKLTMNNLRKGDSHDELASRVHKLMIPESKMRPIRQALAPIQENIALPSPSVKKPKSKTVTSSRTLGKRKKSRAKTGKSSRFTRASVKKMLEIFTVEHLRRECRGYKIPDKGDKKTLMTKLASTLISKQHKSLKSRPHPGDCGCDLCDLELAVALNNLKIFS
ncbi:hypothetical protein AAMO2058_001535600 [Amorphochlora amoebiformis]